MGIDPLTLGVMALAGGTGISAIEQRKARKEAEKQAALERESLAALQAEPTPEMPAIPRANDDATRRARRRSIASRMRGGRQSTILTGGDVSEPLGGA